MQSSMLNYKKEQQESYFTFLILFIVGTAKLIIDRSPLYILIINWMGCTNEGTYLLSLL